MPTARNGLAAAAVNGKIYAMGGRDGNNGALYTVEVYDPNINSWSTAASMSLARQAFAAVAVNGKIYAIGGLDAGGVLVDTATVEVYDPATNAWCANTGPNTVQCPTLPAHMPTARFGLAAAAVNGKIYAIGGRDGNNGALNTVEVYDPSSNSWSTAASMPTARDSLAAADANRVIYAFGGRDQQSTNRTMEQYSPPVTIYTFTKN